MVRYGAHLLLIVFVVGCVTNTLLLPWMLVYFILILPGFTGIRSDFLVWATQENSHHYQTTLYLQPYTQPTHPITTHFTSSSPPMSKNKPAQWNNVGRATTSQYWAPSSTSIRPTIAKYAVSQNKFSPTYLRQPFGEVNLQSSSERDYNTASQHTSFLQRNNKLRNSMSASGLSFIRDIAESIPLPSFNQPNLITRRPQVPKRVDPYQIYQQSLKMKQTTVPTSPLLTPNHPTTNSNYGSVGLDASGTTSKGYQQIGRPEHGRRKVFIDAAFNASNNASTGMGMSSGMGVLKAQSFYTDKNRPFNGPKIHIHKIPKFTNYSTKQTQRRAFLSPTIGRKTI